jgi:hypothetical protein
MTLSASDVSAVVVTRGDVPLDDVLEPLSIYGEVIVADNSKLPVDLGIYARFDAMAYAKFPIIYTQDDDIVFRNHEELLAHYKPGVLVTAYPQPCDNDIPWISTGAIFDKSLVRPAFQKYLQHFPFDHFMTHKAADAIFCLLTEKVEVHPMPYEELAWAVADNRVHTSEGWYERDRPEARDRCLRIK